MFRTFACAAVAAALFAGCASGAAPNAVAPTTSASAAAPKAPAAPVTAPDDSASKQATPLAAPPLECAAPTVRRTANLVWDKQSGAQTKAACAYCAALDWKVSGGLIEYPAVPIVFVAQRNGGEAVLDSLLSAEDMDLDTAIAAWASGLEIDAPGLKWLLEANTDDLKEKRGVNADGDVDFQLLALRGVGMHGAPIAAQNTTSGWGAERALPQDDAVRVLRSFSCTFEE